MSGQTYAEEAEMTERREVYVAGQLPVGMRVRLFDVSGKLGVVGQVLGTVAGYSEGAFGIVIHVLRDDGVRETASPRLWQPLGTCPVCGREFEEGGDHADSDCARIPEGPAPAPRP